MLIFRIAQIPFRFFFRLSWGRVTPSQNFGNRRFTCGDLEGGKRARGYPTPEVDALEGLPGSELIHVRFTPESGHFLRVRKMSANDP